MSSTGGPLAGVTVLEMAGIGPVPFASMVLADMGADVVMVERKHPWDPRAGMDPRAVLTRGRRSLALDLKHPEGPGVLLRLVEHADVLLEGFRPGVMERLGLGPEVCHERNPALVYGRMTGWGQDGPMAQAAGHDLNYVALSGILDEIGRDDRPPPPPLNAIGDFGGGSMFLIAGVLAALHRATTTGIGDVIDAAMVDGASLFTTMFRELATEGQWSHRRGRDFLNGGAHFYDVYRTADDRFVSVGAIEPHFYDELLDVIGVEDPDRAAHGDPRRWDEMRDVLSEVFATKTRDEWCELLEGTDACFAPVLGMREAPDHPHHQHRNSFVTVDGVVQPAPAPRFASAPAPQPSPCPPLGHDTRDVLQAAGWSADEIDELASTGAVHVGR